ncbi:hypothetical protein LUZ60_011094 [Juncus effusus]|nr:hypothetical protein LUZ60_011094 [Juncus effusus]
MQTPKSRSNSKDIRNRTSPVGAKPNWNQKTVRSESSSSSESPNRISPKIEKRPTKLGAMESQFSHLQEELKQTKDQLISSELFRKRIQQEADEAKKQVSLLSSKLKESESQDDSRIFELRKLAQERDRAWQSELEAMQKQHSADSTALASAMNEVFRLKGLVRERERERDEAKEMMDEMRQELEVSKGNIDSLLVDGSKLMDSFGAVVRELEDSRVRVKMLEEMVSEFENEEKNGEMESEELRKRFEMFEEMVSRFEKEKQNGEMELEELRVRVTTFEEMVSKFKKERENGELELEESRVRVKKLEEMVSKFEMERGNVEMELEESKVRVKELEEVVSKLEMGQNRETEVEDLRGEFENAVMKSHEEEILRIVQLQCALELMEKMKIESSEREEKLEETVNSAKTDVIKLKAILFDKDDEIRRILNLNKKTEDETESGLNLKNLREELGEKDFELQRILHENEILQDVVRNLSMEKDKFYEESIKEKNEARKKEKNAGLKIKVAIEEAKENKEKLGSIQNKKEEMEMELKKLRVQADQWKKAAETAMALLTVGNKDKLIERSDSLDSNSNLNLNSVSGKFGSLNFPDELDDETQTRKNLNVLRRISGMWKK